MTCCTPTATWGAARARGLAVTIVHVSETPPRPPTWVGYYRIRYDLGGPRARYRDERGQEAVMIAGLLEPDALVMVSRPSVEAERFGAVDGGAVLDVAGGWATSTRPAAASVA